MYCISPTFSRRNRIRNDLDMEPPIDLDNQWTSSKLVSPHNFVQMYKWLLDWFNRGFSWLCGNVLVCFCTAETGLNYIFGFCWRNLDRIQLELYSSFRIDETLQKMSTLSFHTVLRTCNIKYFITISIVLLNINHFILFT